MTVMRTISVFFAAAACVTCLACGQPAKPDTVPTATPGDGGVSEDVATRKILHRKDLAEAPGKEVIVIQATIPPHSAIGRHTHPGQEVAYVVSGSIQLINDGEESRTVNAGETVSTSPGKPHDVKNVGSEPAKIIDFMLVEKGQPLTTQAK
jgi:quercetin dioxygenase-like cupin family protein